MSILSLNQLKRKKVKTLDELIDIRFNKRKDEKMIFASGCFDILHKDHIEYLAWARNLGDYLLIAINSDESIKQLKGKDRPIKSVENRVMLLVANYYVDYITIFNELDTVNIIKTLKPDIFSRGKDYVLDTASVTNIKKVMNQKERQIVEKYGGEICFLNKIPKYSTTKLISLMKNSNWLKWTSSFNNYLIEK